MAAPHVRASESERDVAIDRLRAAAAEGRLDHDESKERVAAALSARTDGELDALLNDLPTAASTSRADRTPMRCFGDGNPLYAAYHDDEWGLPVTDERGLYERLCLEAFQSGLSWLVILRKRPRFREVFAGFDPEIVAGYGEADVQRLLQDAGIVRNRAKVEATIANARATLTLRDGPRNLVRTVWDHRPERALGHPVPASLRDVPAHVPESAALARALKRAGFRFLGPTTLYATMQACGLVNDHVAGCRSRTGADAAQATALAALQR